MACILTMLTLIYKRYIFPFAKAPDHEVMEHGSKAPHILDLYSRWTWLVSIMLLPQPLHPQYPLDYRLG